ncbi:MAG TPA: PHB depolymerase family esterase [Acidimicrobiales bacterium]
MGERTRGSRWTVVCLVLAMVAGACSSPRAAGPSTTRAGATGAPVASAGCSASSLGGGSAPAPATGLRQDITVDGVARWYLLTTPPTHNGTGPVPLVVDLHGLAEGATLHAQTSQFGPEAQTDGFIVVFPEGTGAPVSWDIAPATRAHPNHDIDFMNAMLNAVEAQQCVDTSRVYADGFSDGALFTSLLACTMANRFAAFAPVAGIVMPKPCTPGREVPILAFHGTADPILYFNGGIGTAVLNHDLGGGGPAPTTTAPPPIDLKGKGYPANVRAWAAKDRCNLRPTDTKVSAHVILRTYRCPPGAAVEFYIVLGGGHAWPGSKVSAELKSITGPSTFEINATAIIWKFFRQHRRVT